MKTILKMTFPDDTTIDVGSIAFDRYGEILHLLGVDVSKLNNILTRNACLETYGAYVFYFQSGDIAIVDDTQRAFVYNSDSDNWHEWEI